jgi:hypothetical protein
MNLQAASAAAPTSHPYAVEFPSGPAPIGTGCCATSNIHSPIHGLPRVVRSGLPAGAQEETASPRASCRQLDSELPRREAGWVRHKRSGPVLSREVEAVAPKRQPTTDLTRNRQPSRLCHRPRVARATACTSHPRERKYSFSYAVRRLAFTVPVHPPPASLTGLYTPHL